MRFGEDLALPKFQAASWFVGLLGAFREKPLSLFCPKFLLIVAEAFCRFEDGRLDSLVPRITRTVMRLWHAHSKKPHDIKQALGTWDESDQSTSSTL